MIDFIKTKTTLVCYVVYWIQAMEIAGKNVFFLYLCSSKIKNLQFIRNSKVFNLKLKEYYVRNYYRTSHHE